MNNISKFFKFIISILKVFFNIFIYLLKFSYTVANLLRIVLKKVTSVCMLVYEKIKKRFYFSITFKFTISYAFIFSVIMFLLSAIVLVIFKLNLIDKLLISNNLSIKNQYLILLIIVNFIGFLTTLKIGSNISKKFLLPIEDMNKTVKDISINHLDTRINIAGTKDELKELAKTFNEMLDRLQKSYEQQNQFVSDASHELRTPIAVIQGYINLLDRWGKNNPEVLNESILAIKSESANMKDLIEKLLFLARADKNTQTLQKNNFCLHTLISEVIKETKLIDNTHTILCEKNDEIHYFGDEKLIKQAIRIFIDNSIKFTPEGGKITLNSFITDGKIIIEIDDSGIGITKEDITHIFDRFYTTDKSRSKDSTGNGLGLAIVKWIIAQHKGSIKVQSKINFGTKITIILPILNKVG